MTKRILAVALCGLLLSFALLLGCGGMQTQKRYEASFLDVFDTVTQLVLYANSEADAREKAEAIHAELTAYHRLFDGYHDYDGVNNLKTVNDSAGKAPVAVDQKLIGLVLYAKQMYALTDGTANIAMGSVLSIWHDAREAGVNDPTSAALPSLDALTEAAKHADINDVLVDETAGTIYLADESMRLDVGAIAKGYAVQRVVETLRQSGVVSALVSVGGNVAAIGKRLDGSPWRIAIESPDGGSPLAVVAAENQSLVTSGSYQRYYTVDGKQYHHIIDPDTLFPAQNFSSVSVLAADSALADALSTALFILPLDAGQKLIASLDNVEAYWLKTDGTRARSDGFPAALIEGN